MNLAHMYSDIFRAKLPPKLSGVQEEGGVLTKAGVAGAPGVDNAQATLAIALRKLGVEGPLLDLRAMGGLLGLALDVDFTPIEQSCAALRVLGEQFDGVRAALPPADLMGDDLGQFPAVALVLSGERGNAHVAAMLAWAAKCTQLGGTLYLAGDKQKGFERYFKGALGAFGAGEIVARDGGMRAARLEKLREAELPVPETTTYQHGELTVAALPGVFSAGHLDKASALLLRHLGDVQGKSALDLGCGAGVLGAACAAGGAGVTLLDDDLAAVVSARETLRLSGLAGEVRHSDVASALGKEERFDLIVSNPPFHVGRRVVLDVALEFVRAAGDHLAPGGELRLVANDFLPYEGALAEWGRVEVLTREGGFKVLRAVKG